MKKLITFLLLASTGLFFNCNSGDSSREEKTPREAPVNEEQEEGQDPAPGNKSAKIAAEICDCLGDIDRGLSQKAKNIFNRSMESQDPESTVDRELSKLGDRERIEVSREIEEFSASLEDEDSPFNACMERTEKKYPNFGDDEKGASEIVKAMGKEKDCSFVAGMLRAIMKEANQ